MSRVLIIGCGGVATVAINKCCQNSEVFTEICIASRTKSKCDALKDKLQPDTKTVITTAKVDADNVEELVKLIESYKPEAVLNLALPYQDLTIMDACLKTKVHYIDTANYEAEDTEDPEWRAIYEKRCKEEGFSAYFDYSWQWNYKKQFEEAGIMGLLGTGFAAEASDLELHKNTIAYGVDNLAQFAEENASSGQITKENMNNLEQVMEQCKGSTDKIANVSAELVTQIKKFSGNGLKKR